MGLALLIQGWVLPWLVGGGAAQSHLGFPMGWNLHPGNSEKKVKDKLSYRFPQEKGKKDEISYSFPQEKDKTHKISHHFLQEPRSPLPQSLKGENLDLEAVFTYFWDKPGRTQIHG